MAARRLISISLIVLGAVLGVNAQVAAPATQMVNVGGRAMQVAVAGLDQRKPGQPVIVLETGAGETGIEPWTPVFAKLTRVAPVIAYDRRGVGQSEADTEKVTLQSSPG
jgi:pimeloyl-ACP methyl ester carboxylesterase